MDGAHDTPPGTLREHVETLLSEQLPAVVEQGIARSADVFCEPGWFTVEESEDILRASRKAGLELRMHVDEFVDGGGAEPPRPSVLRRPSRTYHTPMAVRLNMKTNGVNTGFLPGTPYAMGDQWPDMTEIVEHEVFYLGPILTKLPLSIPLMCSLMVQRCGMNPLLALSGRGFSSQNHPPVGTTARCSQEGAVANFNIVMDPIGKPFVCVHRAPRFPLRF